MAAYWDIGFDWESFNKDLIYQNPFVHSSICERNEIVPFQGLNMVAMHVLIIQDCQIVRHQCQDLEAPGHQRLVP